MSGRPPKGAPVRFVPADGFLPQASDTVLGLRFNIETRYGGIFEVDLTDLRPRALAIAFAGALRRQSELSGSLCAASTIKQHMHAYRRFFAYHRDRCWELSGECWLKRIRCPITNSRIDRLIPIEISRPLFAVYLS